MTYDNYVLTFSYDANGIPVSFHVKNATLDKDYYYGTNSRGDIEVIYNADGTLHARYDYDAYGKILSVTAPDGTNITAPYAIANLNPLRYRSYVYDNETGLYYLQSRYYDPITCRFINADSYISTGQDINGFNMFAYCGNNPVGYFDPTGTKFFECCPHGDCHYCKTEKESDVLVISNKLKSWIDSSITMGKNMAAALGAKASFTKPIYTFNFNSTWANTSASCVIIHTHGTSGALSGEDFIYYVRYSDELTINTNIKHVLITACSTGGDNGYFPNVGQYLSTKIAPDGIVVCSTTDVNGNDTHFTPVNNGKWIAYQNGQQIPANFPTTITMADVAEFWNNY